jgi:hypothetical protein
VTTTFIIDRKQLHAVLLSIKKQTPKCFKTGIVQINIPPNQIELHAAGITKYLSAQTKGYCDILVPMRLLYAFSSTMSAVKLKFKVKRGEIRCGNSTFKSSEITIRPMFNMDNEVMPMIAAEFDLLKYVYEPKASELENFKLTRKISNTREKLRSRLLEAIVMLDPYHMSYAELQNLVNSKFQT